MKEFSDQTRIVIASALSLAVIIVWGLLYRAPTPPPQPANPTPSSAATVPASGSTNPSTPSTLQAAPASPAAISDTSEKNIVVESDLYRVVLSNRGALVRGWQLKKYTDANRRPLELVNTSAGEENTNWPFSLQMSDAQLEQTANRALYAITPAAQGENPTITAPATIEFRWSDGQTTVTKRLKFDDSYILQFESSVQRNGQPVQHRIAWRGGFGDFAVPPQARVMTAFTGLAGAIRTITPGNLGDPKQRTNPAEVPGTFDVVGIEDHYFAAAFMPPEPSAGQPLPAVMTMSGKQLVRNAIVDGKTQPETLPEISAGSTMQDPLTLRTFVGPKDLDVLKSVRPPLDGLVQFGWFGFIAAPLFYVLRWMHGFIPNYGWAIVLLTVAINMLLYPLTLRSWRSMQKMQRVAPEIRSIQDRYKKYSMRDPRKAEMNKEVMAVYGREGINPMGSCLPTLAQFPIWYGVNRMLTATIELRHVPFLWIADLAAKDPYYILPVAMVILMFVQQKMMPMTATDPQQQRMMNMMPLMMGAMFIFLPLSSGLYLYILTSNAIGVAQRWHLNRTSPIKTPGKRKDRDKETNDK